MGSIIIKVDYSGTYLFLLVLVELLVDELVYYVEVNKILFFIPINDKNDDG